MGLNHVCFDAGVLKGVNYGVILAGTLYILITTQHCWSSFIMPIKKLKRAKTFVPSEKKWKRLLSAVAGGSEIETI